MIKVKEKKTKLLLEIIKNQKKLSGVQLKDFIIGMYGKK
jgi:hypothetical protein